MMVHSGEESGFERRARAVLEESVARIDARTRSRLNRARQAALEIAAARRHPLRFDFRRSVGVLPIAGAVAAAVLAVALTLFMRGDFHSASKTDAAQASFEVLDMLADDDSITFMENYDHSFYEWAAAQADAAGGADGSGGPAGGAAGEPAGSTSGGASG